MWSSERHSHVVIGFIVLKEGKKTEALNFRIFRVVIYLFKGRQQDSICSVALGSRSIRIIIGLCNETLSIKPSKKACPI